MLPMSTAGFRLRRHYLQSASVSYLIWLIFSIIWLSNLTATQDLVLQKCLPKADMHQLTIKCNSSEIIAIKEAFFTSSVMDQCPFSSQNRSNEILQIPKKVSCTDDLRVTLNSRCSGRPDCSFNLAKAHQHQCSGYDGWINIKYVCVPKTKMISFCNLELKDKSGYISNPGYPKFYPPYNCKWKIKAYPGQKIQIDILDLSLKEPRFTNKKTFSYECNDYVSIIEDNAKVATLCGEVKSNLIEYRSKTEELIVDFISYDFSPTRGILFKYTLINCPTLKPPVYGDMHRKGSYAYYNCQYDYVFEDTGLTTRVLFCEFDTYWNASVTRCVPKENVTMKDYQLISQNDAPISTEENNRLVQFRQNKLFSRGLLTPIALLIIGQIVLASILVMFCILRKRSSKRTEV